MPKPEDLFAQALRLSPEERTNWLQDACGDDEGLRARVQELLRAQEEIDSRFLEQPPEALQHTVIEPVSENSGSEIGPYKLREQLGEGGMGTVFVADQKEPVKRRVALKIIKPGMDSAQVIARFEAERQALAMMDHPGIARVLDAGTTATGRPYFAMELVKGVPITQYCDDRQLSPRERLELIIPVCHAVQHAHLKGVVHRDIKPSNLLVAEYDDRPVPMIIDFGIAKALNSELTEKTVYTQYGQLIGTLEYMSPEQAKLNQLDIDTRSDVYSLGVVLYELLTGTTPLTREQLRSVGYDEMLRMIRETEAPRPSTRLTQSKELPAISAKRQSAPQKLGALMKGELDWIVMKALEKDRTRRYSSASDLGDDIQRYLDDEPVEACPPSALYRFSKFVRRNRAAAATFGVIAVGLLIAAIGAGIGYFRLQQALVVERDSRTDVEESLAKVEVARSEAVESKNAALESERVATEALEKLKESQEAERRAAQENALYHASAASAAIDGLSQHKPLALQTAVKALENLPDDHPARERLRNQIEWGLLCTPKLVHQMEIPSDARFGYSNRYAFGSLPKLMFVFRGEDRRPPLIRLFTETKRIRYYVLKCFTEIQIIDPNTGRLTPITLKGRFRRIFPCRDPNVLVTVDEQPRATSAETVRFWDLRTGTEFKDAVEYKGAGRVVGAIDDGDVLLIRSKPFGANRPSLLAVDHSGRLLGEASVKVWDVPDAKRIRVERMNTWFVTDLGQGRFQLQVLNKNERSYALGKLSADGIQFHDFGEATPTACRGTSDVFAMTLQQSNETEGPANSGFIRVLSSQTQQQIGRDLPLITGSGQTSLVMSEDSRVLLVRRKTGSTAELQSGSEFWDLDRARPMCRLEMKSGDSTRNSPNGRFVALIEPAPAETHITLHRTENGSRIGLPITLPGKFDEITFSADSRRLFTVYETPDDEKRHIFQVWEIPGLDRPRPIPSSGGSGRAMAVNSAGELCICRALQGGGFPESGMIHVWDMDSFERTRVMKCRDTGNFGHNTFGSRPDTAVSWGLGLDLQARIHLHDVSGNTAIQTVTPSVRLVSPTTLRLTRKHLFWKTMTGSTFAYDLRTEKEVAFTDGPPSAPLENPTLSTDDGSVHFQVGKRIVERSEFDGQSFKVTHSRNYGGPQLAGNGGPRYMTLGRRHIVIATDEGFRRISRSDLTADSPFLSLGSGTSDILAVDNGRDRIAVYNSSGQLAVIDIASGRPLLQRTIQPGSRWHLACFDPSSGDLIWYDTYHGLVYRLPIHEDVQNDSRELMNRVTTFTGVNTRPDQSLQPTDWGERLRESLPRTGPWEETTLAAALALDRRGHLKGARLYADRVLSANPDHWMALLIRGAVDRSLGVTSDLQTDVRRAVSLAKKQNQLNQLLPWLEHTALVQLIPRDKRTTEERIAMMSEYIDIIRELPQSGQTLTILMENAHDFALANDLPTLAEAIRERAIELDLKNVRF